MQWHLILLFESWPRFAIWLWKFEVTQTKRHLVHMLWQMALVPRLISPWPLPFLCISMPDVQMPAPILHLDTFSVPKVSTLGAALATGWQELIDEYPLPHPSRRITLWHMFYFVSQSPLGDWAPAAHSANRPGNISLTGCPAVPVFLFTALLVLPEIKPLRNYI